MGTYVYVDGLNLYYGALYGTPFRWLDIAALCSRLLPRHTIDHIWYFTARVVGHPHDSDAPLRQDIYLRALKTIPNLTINDDSRFSRRIILLPQFPLAYPNNRPIRPPQQVQVLKLEEKRSDVNLASTLLDDCFRNHFDEAVVISNDSDLTTPIKLITTNRHKRIGVINPHPPRKLSRELTNVASWYMRTINRSALARCQFAPSLTDTRGTFTKPSTW